MEVFKIGDWPTGNLDVDIGRADVGPRQIVLKTKKPYIINSFQIECVTGEWNKEKEEYGVRVYFVSGNNLWFGGEVARDILQCLTHRDHPVLTRFDERVKAGMPKI